MYWLQPPPYARWAAATLLVLGALWWDLRAPPTAQHPFAARAIASGQPIADGDIRWDRLPRDTFPVPNLEGAVTAVAIAPGEPITAAMLAPDALVPEDWWAVPIDIGAPTSPGDTVMLVVLDPPLSVPGIVVEPQRGDSFSLDHRPALVAVPGDAAAVIAAAESAGLLVAAVRPGAG